MDRMKMHASTVGKSTQQAGRSQSNRESNCRFCGGNQGCVFYECGECRFCDKPLRIREVEGVTVIWYVPCRKCGAHKWLFACEGRSPAAHQLRAATR